MSITQSVTMASMKPGEDADNSLWQGYTLHAHSAVSGNHPTVETNIQPVPLSALPYHERPQKGSYRSLDVPSTQSRPPPQPRTGVLTTSPTSLNNQHSYTSLKRTFHITEDSPYGDAVRDFREEPPDLPKPSINQDNRLLSFSRAREKRTIIDNDGRVHQVELAAQIHGMFFLSEMPTAGGDGRPAQAELTCYRRNLFQISGSVTAPRCPLSVITERGERFPIIALEVSVSASESVDGHPVKLIVIPWKTPPPNAPEVGPGQEHEPAPIPILPFEDGSPEGNGDLSVYPIVYRRLQFRIATANNGRRRELQQHFILHLSVVATLANESRINICETNTAPIVVRGRSPRNFQARKGIPLLGSSSSRSGLPDLHVATNIGASTGSVCSSAEMSKLSKLQNPELPRSPFSLDSSHHLPSSPLRTSSYPPYVGSHLSENSTASNSSNYPPPSMGLENYLQMNHSSPDLSNSQPPSSAMAGPSHPPIRQQYVFQHGTVSPTAPPIRFMDSNPRPSKSPRHIAPPELSSASPYSESGTRYAPPYTTSNDGVPERGTGYFPGTMPMQTWSPPGTTGAYGRAVHSGTPTAQHYHFPNEPYVKEESNLQPSYSWNTS